MSPHLFLQACPFGGAFKGRIDLTGGVRKLTGMESQDSINHHDDYVGNQCIIRRIGLRKEMMEDPLFFDNTIIAITIVIGFGLLLLIIFPSAVSAALATYIMVGGPFRMMRYTVLGSFSLRATFPPRTWIDNRRRSSE